MSIAVDSAELVNVYGTTDARAAAAEQADAPRSEAQPAPLDLTLRPSFFKGEKSLIGVPNQPYSLDKAFVAAGKTAVGGAIGVGVVTKMYPNERDKILHAAAGAVAAGLASEWVLHRTDDRVLAAIAGVVAAVGVGALKEGVDAMGLGHPSREDFIATAVGGFPVSLIYTIKF